MDASEWNLWVFLHEPQAFMKYTLVIVHFREIICRLDNVYKPTVNSLILQFIVST